MEYCKKCKISYETGECVDDPERELAPCPLCSIEKQLGKLWAKNKDLKSQIDRFRICEECQRSFGYCDKERSQCDKLN